MYRFKRDELDRIIAEKGLKIGYIAKELGMTQQTFSNKRSGKVEWYVTEIGRLMAILGCEFNELFDE